ncbi:MAG: hypothetical protein HC927_01515 [Deltaproteobacteria bacterium]|nr:hypothetical protein [Deltaproteobacteria bacterium]
MCSPPSSTANEIDATGAIVTAHSITSTSDAAAIAIPLSGPRTNTPYAE